MTTNWQGKHILVVGLGRTGLALCRHLSKHGAVLRATDTRPETELGEAAKELRSLGIELALGGHPEAWFTQADAVVLSPGVPPSQPAIAKARAAGIHVMGEIEIASRLLPEGRLIAVTGTNGKSTTVTLIARMLEAAGKRVVLCGNVGNAFLGAVDEHEKDMENIDWWVVEVSSYQLETIESFRPRIAALMNVTADHSDRYASMADYRKTKERIFENQQAGDTAIVNADEEQTQELSKRLEAGVQEFSFTQENSHAFVKGDEVWLREKAGPQKLLSLPETRLLGRHNLQNLMAAAQVSRAAGADIESIQKAARAFEPLPHVMIEVAGFNGVRFFNNSKATNVDAAVQSLRMFDDASVALILGGRDKGGDYAPLWDAARSKVKRFILVGENRELLRSKLNGTNAEVIVCDSLHEAVVRGTSGLQPGDTVLLAPAASSFDMYENYKQRGDDFVRAVEKLKKEVGA